jgi:outer membrane protein TolC
MRTPHFPRPLERFVSLVVFAVLGLGPWLGAPSLQAQDSIGGMPEDLVPRLRPILAGALTQSPQSMQRAIDLAQAEANRYFTSSTLWPSATGSVQYAITNSQVSAVNSVSSDTSGLFYGFNVNQPLFQWGAVRAQAEVGTIAVKIAERQYAEGYRILVHTLRSQYLGLIARKMAVAHVKAQLARAEATLRVEEDRLATGSLSPGGIISPRMVATELRLRAEQSEADFAYGLRVFARLAGLADFSADALPNEVPRPVAMASTADSLLAGFLSRSSPETPQAQTYVYYIQQADLNYHIAKTRLYPKFSLYAGYSLNNSTSATLDSISQVGVTSFNYGVVASWTIFDGFASRGAKRAALATKRTYELQKRTYEDTVMDSAQNIHRQLGFSLRALEMAEQRRALAEDAVRITTEDIRLGSSAQIELDGAMASFHVADLAAMYARSDYFARWSEFVSLVGADPAMNNLPARYVRSQP